MTNGIASETNGITRGTNGDEEGNRGGLTAEQVRDAIERHSAWVIGNNRCFRNGAYEEIADELNKMLGVGECEVDGSIQWQWTGPTTYYEYELSCGHTITSLDEEPPNYCEECGKAVKR